VLAIYVEEAGACTICRPVGELDAFTVTQFRQALAAMASVPQLVIDLAGVPFIDSAGFGALMGGTRRVRELGGDVAVACPRPQLNRFLHTTGLDRIVTVTVSVEAATKALNASQEIRGPNRPSRHE
jgi:anti-sigma B factor antagonist